jgi:hypothetical protein
MHRKHTVHVFRDLPDLIYRMLSQVSSMRERIDWEIAAMKSEVLGTHRAHHLMVEAIRGTIIPASRLPKVIEAWEAAHYREFEPRTAWSLFNALPKCKKAQARVRRWKEVFDSVSSFGGSCPSTRPLTGPSTD